MKRDRLTPAEMCIVTGIVFIILKLTGVIHCSWVVALMPFWIIPAVAVLIIALPMVAAMIVWMFKRR